MKKMAILVALVLSLMVSSALADSVVGFATDIGVLNEDNSVTATLSVGEGDVRTFTTAPLSDLEAAKLLQGADKAGISFVNYPIKNGAFVEAVLDENGNCTSFNVIEKAGTFFDVAKYGGEMAPVNGEPGNMVAKGWVLAKTDAMGKRTITLGDGNDVTNVFRQTYELADDCTVYLVDNAVDCALTVGSFDDINVTACIDGHIYSNPERWTAICIFDGNYKTYGNGAKVSTIYVNTTADQIAPEYCIEPDAMPQLSDYQTVTADDSLAHVPEFAPWLTSTRPFEILHDRLWWIGDNEVAVYLIKTADGKLAMFDSGWPLSGYQYWQNIEACGFDPRDIDTILLTHGHGDHYATAWDVEKLIKNTGNDPLVYESALDCTTGGADFGFPEIAPILNDAATLSIIDDYYTYGEWFSIGEGVECFVDASHGHTIGSSVFVLKFTVADDDPVFEPGTVVAFEYMGGYGSMTRLSQGYTRLAFVYGLRYIQQVIVPMMAEVADYSYVLPQHTNHYPLIEINKAAELAGVPTITCMQEGGSAIENQLEKRIDSSLSQSLWLKWVNGEDISGGTCSVSNKNNSTIEADGPFKRPVGEYEIELVDGGKLIQGYNQWLNPCDSFEGQYNIDGEDMSKGFVIEKDSYVHDPEGWYVQVAVHVMDDYDGAVRYDDNFYTEYASQWTSGPVESIHGEGWFEVIRTGRIDSKEEAQALLDTLQKGGHYKVQLNTASDIVNAENLLDTFVPVK